jgi:filamentous hemagglutinin family protein
VISRNSFTQGCKLGLSSLLIVVVAMAEGGDRTFAQVTADPSLGTEVRTIDGNTLEITGGRTVGDKNLFHSFSNFSVKSEEVVKFLNNDIKNILVRVTGGNPSDILGQLQAQGKANLFLINPNGIVFGENAELNIGGSFIATTASAIQFPGGGEFSMTSPVNSLNPLLTVNPSALLFNQIAKPISIINNTIPLSVEPGQKLLLVGGDVKLDGAVLQAQRSGKVELGGLAGVGTVELNIDSNNFSLGYPVGVQLADVTLSNGSTVTASGIGSGSIQVQGRRIILSDRSRISVNNLGSQPGGTLTVNASELVELLGGSSLLSNTQFTGDAGQITIETGRLIVKDGSQVSASTYDQGRGGTISVTARDSIQLIGTQGDIPSGLFTIATGESTGDAGNLSIKTGQLIVKDGAQISTSTLSQGRGGTLSVSARDSIQLIGTSTVGKPSGLLVGTEATGDAGNLEIETGQLIVQDGARISASTSKNSTGVGGSITVKTGELNVLNRAEVTVSSQGTGNAGELRVNANSIKLDQGKLAGTTASGRGGDISLQVQDLIVMRNRSAIATTAANNGSGGNIRINAPFIVAVPDEDSDILANANQGSGGRIEINATDIYGLEDRTKLSPNPKISEINASSDFGVNGTVEINTPEIDPNRGLVNLPTVPLDTKVAQACESGTAENQSSFTITGRGGLPPNPRTEPLTPDAVQVDWVTLKPRSENRISTNVSQKATSPTPAPIVEAQGWVRNSKGEVVLTAYAPTATPHSSWLTAASCP